LVGFNTNYWLFDMG